MCRNLRVVSATCESIEFDSCSAWPTSYSSHVQVGAPESLLYKHLSEWGVPVQLYDDFPFVIARFFEGRHIFPIHLSPNCVLGANCLTLHLVNQLACSILGASARIDDRETCLNAITDKYMSRCAGEFPPLVSFEQQSIVPSKSNSLLHGIPEPPRTQALDLNAMHSSVITTSGCDGHQVVGQLALCFTLEQHEIEELLVAFFNFVYSPTDLGGDTCMVSISRRTIHYAINRLWNGHQGYARCVPKCQADDVKILVNGSIRQPLRFQCKQDLHGQKPARAPTTRSESKR